MKVGLAAIVIRDGGGASAAIEEIQGPTGDGLSAVADGDGPVGETLTGEVGDARLDVEDGTEAGDAVAAEFGDSTARRCFDW